MVCPAPTVSIIVRSYNRASKIGQSIKSVLAQTFQDWELIVVDNHSHDDTDAVVYSFSDERIRLHKIHNHGIISASLNLGLSVSRGEFIAILDSDDWWTQRKLELSIRRLESGFDVVHHSMFKVPSLGFVDSGQIPSAIQINRSLDLRNPYDDLFWLGNGLSNSSVVIRKSKLQELGGFTEDPNCLGAEDYHTWLGLARNGCSFSKLPDVLGYLIFDEDNLWSCSMQITALSSIFQEFQRPSTFSNPFPAWACYSVAMSYLGQNKHRPALDMFRRALSAPKAPTRFRRKDMAFRLKAFSRMVILIAQEWRPFPC